MRRASAIGVLRFLPYAYDGMNRVTKTWTDITGQSDTTPLVEYSYDSFGNKPVVKTRTDAQSDPRETVYTYDKNNRANKE